MSDIAKPIQDDEVHFANEDDSSLDEAKKAPSGFTPTRRVSWPWSRAKPPEEPETDLGAAQRIPAEVKQVNRVLDNREEAEKARQDDHRHDPDGDRVRSSIEAKYATGFTHQAGKHTAHTGALTRGSGRLKIFAETVSAEQLEEWTGRAQEFAKIAPQVLRGRNATIFEQLVLNPMLGKPGQSVGELAVQFNVKPSKIYKLKDRALTKTRAAYLRHEQGEPLKPEGGPRWSGPIEHWVEHACWICGRPKFDSTKCPRRLQGLCWPSPRETVTMDRIVTRQTIQPEGWKIVEAERQAATMARLAKQKEAREAKDKLTQGTSQ